MNNPINNQSTNSNNAKKSYDVIIIGSGPGGLSAGLYTSRANLKTAIFEGPQPKGQLTTTTSIENYPGFDEDDANLLMNKMHQQCKNSDCDMIQETITKIAPQSEQHIIITTNLSTYHCKAVILATGAKAKYLGLESEKKYLGYGVSTCATCDGAFFRNVPVAVVGGGNTAVEEAIYLANIASHVHVIHRRDTFRAEEIMQDRMKKLPNITFHLNSVLHEVLGDDTQKLVNGINISNNKTNEITKIDLEGVFIAIGHSPQTELVKDLVELDQDGYVISNGVKTNIPGLFVAGDVVDKVYRQAITSAGQGCMAAMEAIKFLH